MSAYRHTSSIPPLVGECMRLAEQQGFRQSCTPETGRLLRLLASHVREGTVAEIGTGCGVGAAWIVSGLADKVRLVSIEIDPLRGMQIKAVLGRQENVMLLTGDWHAILDYKPFAMLFADGGNAKGMEADALIEAMEPQGIIVLDDLTPEDQWPKEWRGKPDPLRDFWLNDQRITATEILVSPTQAVILAVKNK